MKSSGGLSSAPIRARDAQVLPAAVSQKLLSLPASPGCYVFRDKQGLPLYVGKAKSLRSRVKSYFQASTGDERAFIPLLQRQIGDFETIVVGSEKEAAILENSLIKEHQPKYNVKLRDDKEYLSLRLSKEHAWPRLDLVRKPKPDKAQYFGPYHSATAARRTLHLVEKHFQLRTCSDRELSSRKRPCLQFQIKRCPAPCVMDVDAAAYAQQVRAVGLFLEGRHDELSGELEERMRLAANSFEYELAATYRDQLKAVQSIREEQRVVSTADRDQDVVGMFRQGDLLEIQVLYVRGGRVVDRASFSAKGVELPDEEVIGTFLRDHYGEGGAGEARFPDEVLVPILPEAHVGIEEWLEEQRSEQAKRRGGKVARAQILAPARGARRELLQLATDNAQHAFEEKRRAVEDIDARLAKVQVRLRLPTLPRRIECCDISHLGGRDTVGAVVSLLDGVPDKKRYRTYHVKGVDEGDDYGAMYQVLLRRFERGRDAALAGSEADASWELPDLFVVDGGRGQLSVALAAAGDLGLHGLTIVGLAKERERPMAEKLVDRVYVPGQLNPVPLRSNSPELFLLAFARDEAHRFANRGRSKLGKRRRFTSQLDTLPGVGPKTRKALLKTLGSLDGIRQASDEAILQAGANRTQLATLRAALKSGEPGEQTEEPSDN